jgi:uncharacterized protein
MDDAVAAGEASDGTALCLACGLCCDGSIFRAVPLRDDEVEEGRRRNVTLIDKSQRSDATHAMGQPCVLFQEQRCSTYGVWRPRACDAYVCGVLDDHVHGRRSFDDSLAIVTSYRAARSQIGPLATLAEHDEDLEEAPLTVQQKLALAVLKVLRHRHFTRERLGPRGATN